jgi:hypothetical protein
VVGGQVGAGGESRADKVRKCTLLRCAVTVSCCPLLCNIPSMAFCIFFEDLYASL